MRWLSMGCLLATSVLVFAAAEEKSSITAQATGLTIRKPLPSKKKEAFAFSPSGTTVSVTISAPGKHILGIDTKASKLGNFSDDKKTKLDATGPFGMSWLSDFVSINAEGDQCTAEVRGSGVPAKGASKVLLKATLALKCGADEKTTEKTKLAMKKDTAAKVGAFTLKVQGESSPFGGGTIALISDTRNIKSAEFFDAKGKAIKLAGMPYWGPHFGGAGGKMQQALTYQLPQKTESVSVKFTYFNKVESVSVPVDLSMGVGLD